MSNGEELTTAQPTFKIDILSGSVECKGFHVLENGRLVYYGYCINRDREGKEIYRTIPSPCGALRF